MSPQYHAIETVYNGFRFRSRLEARWAVFFDALNIEYRYEPEGFDLDGTRYLPDFWLPQHKVWVEIKPDTPTFDEREKAIKLALATKNRVAILAGDCWHTSISQGFVRFYASKEEMKELLIGCADDPHLKIFWIHQDELLVFDPDYPEPFMGVDFQRELAWGHTFWFECSQCHKFDIHIAWASDVCRCQDKERIFSQNSQPLLDAFTKARQARFSKGE